MNLWGTLALAAALAAGADIPGAASFQTAAPDAKNASSAAAPPTVHPETPAAGATGQDKGRTSKPLQPESRLLLVRYVSGEFAKAVQALPGGKKGLKIPVGKPLNAQHMSDTLRLYGAAISPGDHVQITGMEFRSREIVFQINGGGKKPFHFRDHLQVSAGMGAASVSPPPASRASEGTGSTLILDYGRELPDMSPDDLKHDLSVVLDFSKQRSAAVNWIDTLPPQVQQAIKDRKAIAGMDREMVMAAMGRPEKKVRERDAEGRETEDWIYGLPPEKTTFVTFLGDNVVRVREFN
jgi:hypothetical protein